jgi:hypothetical protein
VIRGTTAQFKFTLPYNFSDLDIVKITFWQDNYSGPDSSRPLPIVKILEQCSQSNRPDELLVFLDGEETLRFLDDRKAYTQLQARTIDGIVFGSKKTPIAVYPVKDDSMLDDNIVPTPTPGDDDFIILDGLSIDEW